MKASCPPHVLKLWLGVSKGMLPVKYFCSNKPSFYVSVEFHGGHKAEVNLATLSFWEYYQIKNNGVWWACLSFNALLSERLNKRFEEIKQEKKDFRNVTKYNQSKEQRPTDVVYGLLQLPCFPPIFKRNAIRSFSAACLILIG